MTTLSLSIAVQVPSRFNTIAPKAWSYDTKYISRIENLGSGAIHWSKSLSRSLYSCKCIEVPWKGNKINQLILPLNQFDCETKIIECVISDARSMTYDTCLPLTWLEERSNSNSSRSPTWWAQNWTIPSIFWFWAHIVPEQIHQNWLVTHPL
jgi:hypothetical protein